VVQASKEGFSEKEKEGKVVLCDDVIKYLQPAREGNWLKFSLKLTLPSRRGAHVVRPTNCPPTSALTDGDFLSLALVDIIIRSTVLFISFRGRMECVPCSSSVRTDLVEEEMGRQVEENAIRA
jgi:hypothetical protein